RALAQQRQLAEHVAPAKHTNQRLRRTLVDHLDATAAHDERALGSFALAHDPVAGAHPHLLHVVGEALEQLLREACENRNVAKKGGGTHQIAATNAAPSRQRIWKLWSTAIDSAVVGSAARLTLRS